VAGEDPSTMKYAKDAFMDPTRYAALSQAEFMLDKARLELAHDPGLVWEEDDTRYLRHVWTPALFSVGRIEPRAAELLERLAAILDATCPKPAGIIALELDLSTLERRIAKRGRRFETIAGPLNHPLRTLFAALHREHSSYVTSRPSDGPPLWSIDASQSPKAILAEALACLRTTYATLEPLGTPRRP
jgi:deoxyadenosine/deoxycytidine kinase